MVYHIGMEMNGEVIYYQPDSDPSESITWVDGIIPADVETELYQWERSLIALSAIINLCKSFHHLTSNAQRSKINA